MIGWFARLLLALAGVITGWFVAREATNFSVIQMVVALLLLVILVGIVAFWPSLRRRASSVHQPREKAGEARADTPQRPPSGSDER